MVSSRGVSSGPPALRLRRARKTGGRRPGVGIAGGITAGAVSRRIKANQPVSDGSCWVAIGRTDTYIQALKGRNKNRMAVQPHPGFLEKCNGSV
ncbi:MULTISPECIES: hypothetical protein [unclassified Imperialibacter]|uniref:hypothetical protein n=1 Tax=unclassified Imperialibacter TaxID=2629706 RepID=UPI00125FBD0B|nr:MULTISPECIES: hypothetical protein [unclassified Imperialibacter]